MVASAELAPSYQPLFCIRGLKLDAVPRCDASSAEQSGEIITCFNLLATCLVIQSRTLLANLLAREALSVSSLRAFPAELLPQAPLSSACTPARGSSFPGARLGICPCRASSGSQYSNSSCFLGIPDYQPFP